MINSQNEIVSDSIEKSRTSNTPSPTIFLKVQELFDQLKVQICPVPLDPFSKKPARSGWADSDYKPERITWARHNGNVAIIPGRSDLLVFDCDTTETVTLFENLARNIGLPLDTLIVKTRKGMHYYYRCEFSKELERKQFQDGQIIRLDVIAGNKYLVVAPYSQLKVKNGEILPPDAKDYELFEYTVINVPQTLPSISREQYEILMQELAKICKHTQKENTKQAPQTSKPQSRQGETKLTEEEIQKIVEIIQPYFTEGKRQKLIFSLAGFLRKDLLIEEESVLELYKHFIDKDDKQDLKARLEAIKRTYAKEDLQKILGWKGLCSTLGEDNARELVAKICEVLNIEHPQAKKEIFIPISEKKLIKVDNIAKEIQLISVRTDQEGNPILSNPQRVFACVFEISVLRNLLDKESFKYEFRCISNHPIEKEYIAKGNLQEIWEQIYANTSYVEMPAIAQTVLTKVSNYFFEKYWFKEKLEELPPGFYYTNEKGFEIIFASKFDNNYTKEELVKAAKFLNEYVSSHPNPQLISSVLKAGLLLPFSFVQKQRASKHLIRWLYLYGTTRTGKTTTAKVIQAIWNHEYITNWASFCTEARASKHLSNSTFPILVDEVGETMENQNISLMLKMVFEEQIARQIQTKTHKTMTFPALASIIMTSNTYFPNDPAYLNRFFVFHFPKSTQIPPHQRQKFSKRELFETLPPIGRFVWDYVLQHGLRDHYIEYAREILQTLFLETLGTIPEWVKMPFIAHNAETEEEQEAEREAIFYSALLSFLHSRVKSDTQQGKYQFARDVYNDLVNMRLGCIYSDGWYVYITKELLETCRKYSYSFTFKTLADIAEITGWEQSIKKIKSKTMRVLKTTIVDFLYQLNLIPKRLTSIEFEQFLKGIDVFQDIVDEKVLDSIDQEVEEELERKIPF